MNILGIHGGVTSLQNEASACLLVDGQVVAASEEERYMRLKGGFGLLPIRSIRACLDIGKLNIHDIHFVAHAGLTHPDLRVRIVNYLNHHFGYCPDIKLIDHQEAHIASAYYQSGFSCAACISYDGYGDKSSMAVARAEGRLLTILKREDLGNSLGRFYSAITSFLGFSPQESEYKVMGLAPYGKQGLDLGSIIEVNKDSYKLDDSYFAGYGKSARSHNTQAAITSRFEPWYTDKMEILLGKSRKSDSEISQHYKDIAYAAQKAFEEAILGVVNKSIELTGFSNLALAGGCALNCKANGLIARSSNVKSLFVQPAASDRGLSLGSALACHYKLCPENDFKPSMMPHVFLGSSYTDDDILDVLTKTGQNFTISNDPAIDAAKEISEGKVIGWFQGRAEFGPRALGHRSILANPMDSNAKSIVNSKVKYREEFRPFAPAVLFEKASEYFESTFATEFMTTAVRVNPYWQTRLKAITHIDGTARVQLVRREVDPLFHRLIDSLGNLTGASVVLNTSFNVMGEPIV